MKILCVALGVCLSLGACLTPGLSANEIYEVLEVPAVPEDDAPSPSDRVVPEPSLLVDCGCAHDHPPIACEPVCGCGPRWTFTIGALYLHRGNPAAAVLATDSSGPGGNVLLDASQFNFNTAWGVETSAIRHSAFGTAWDLEGRYFGVNQWSATAGPIASDSGAWVQYVTPLGNDELPNTISASYLSQLNSFELNGRRWLTDWMQVLAGVRYVELDERGLSILQDIGPGVNLGTHQIGATNQLWGFQLGIDARFLRLGRLDLSTFGKAGIYANSMDNSVLVTQDFGPTYASQASSTGAAFVGELGFVALYQLTDRLSLRASYQLLWLDNVATASNQVAVSDPASSAATVHNGGDVFYHGGFLGAQFGW